MFAVKEFDDVGRMKVGRAGMPELEHTPQFGGFCSKETLISSSLMGLYVDNLHLTSK